MVSGEQSSWSSEWLRWYDPGAIDQFSAFMSTEDIQEQLAYHRQLEQGASYVGQYQDQMFVEDLFDKDFDEVDDQYEYMQSLEWGAGSGGGAASYHPVGRPVVPSFHSYST